VELRFSSGVSSSAQALFELAMALDDIDDATCRRKAEEIAEAASFSVNPETRRLLLVLAMEWEALAEELEGNAEIKLRVQ
jgi:hypothetical protein